MARRLSLYLRLMPRSSRVRLYGLAVMLVFAGGICAVLVHGLVGQLLTLSLISLGLVGVVALVFLEVGLSEDRQRESDEAQRGKPANRRIAKPRRSRSQQPRWPRRPE